MNQQRKKGLTMYVLDVLKQYSDNEHKLKQQEIIEIIQKEHGILFERKAIGTTIRLLESFGFNIVTKRGEGVYLKKREFSESEIAYLVDAIYSSKSLSSYQANNLTNKFYSYLSKYQRKAFSHLYKTEDVARTSNREVFQIINTVHNAIKKNKKISFNLEAFNEVGEPVLKNEGKEYVVSPYYLVNGSGKYYLLLNKDNYNTLSAYRVDLIKNIKVINEPRKVIATLDDCDENFDIANYINSHVYMFGGDIVEVKMTLKGSYAIQFVYDWFGKNAVIENVDGTIYASVTCNKQGFIYWALQYGEHIKVLSPESVVNTIKESAQKILDNYK